MSIHFNYKMEQYSMPGTHCDSFAIHAHVPHIKNQTSGTWSCTNMSRRFGESSYFFFHMTPLPLEGVANGKIQDSLRPWFENPRQRLKSFSKIQARNSVRRKLSPRLHFAKIRAGFENRSQRDMGYTIF